MANNTSLQGKRIAILATDGFEQSELLEPRKALEQAGARNRSSVPGRSENQGLERQELGRRSSCGRHPRPERRPHTTTTPDAVRFVKEMTDEGKPVAAICHGPWTLVDTGIVKGRTVASWPSLKTDIRNAGGNWVDQEVVADERLVTSRKPSDIPAFNRKMVEVFGGGQ